MVIFVIAIQAGKCTIEKNKFKIRKQFQKINVYYNITH